MESTVGASASNFAKGHIRYDWGKGTPTRGACSARRMQAVPAHVDYRTLQWPAGQPPWLDILRNGDQTLIRAWVSLAFSAVSPSAATAFASTCSRACSTIPPLFVSDAARLAPALQQLALRLTQDSMALAKASQKIHPSYSKSAVPHGHDLHGLLLHAHAPPHGCAHGDQPCAYLDSAQPCWPALFQQMMLSCKTPQNSHCVAEAA